MLAETRWGDLMVATSGHPPRVGHAERGGVPSGSQVSLAGDIIEDWDFAGSDTQYATHGMHTWLAAMIPAEARKLIRVTGAKRVLDPFCGGGTVLVECALAGIPARGIEINPLGVIVSRAKTTRVPARRLYDALTEILTRVKNGNGASFIPSVPDIRYWFKPYMLAPLGKIAAALGKIEDEDARTFFQCVFSATARDVSLTHRNEIRLRRMEPDKLKSFNPDIVATFAYRAYDSIRRLQKLPARAFVGVQQGTALSLPFEDAEFSTIITSPPYGDERNGVPYFQFAKNMLYWLGFTREELMALKRKTLGWVNHNERRFETPPSDTLRKLTETIRTERTRKEAIAFYADYYTALREMARVTYDRIAIVIGQRVLENKVFDNGKITTELMQDIGWKLEREYKRRLPSKRLPKMRDFGAAINSEDILIYAPPP